MQRLPNIPPGTLLCVSAACLAIAIIAYNIPSPSSTVTTKPVGQNLHRSNAVRRRARRRWREGAQVVELDYDPTQRALESLRRREEHYLPYGCFSYALWTGSVGTESIYEENALVFAMLPSRLKTIHADVVTTQHLEGFEAIALLVNIQAQFMHSFLETEYPEGYLLWPDRKEIEAALAPYISIIFIRKCLTAWDAGKGNEIITVTALPSLAAMHGQTAEAASNRDVQEEQTSRSHGPATGHNRTAAELAVALEASTGRGTSMDDEENDHEMLDVLYKIAEEQGKRRGFQHRGVECNSCGMQPILGIRYHCANCYDFDLCEACESQQFHTPTHVFYKIRIPAPTRGQIKLVQPKWYPGQANNSTAISVPKTVKTRLLDSTSFDRQDIDALYDQFKCIASVKDTEDEDKICIFIGRRDFDRYFTTTTADRPPKPNLLYDRIFKFYCGPDHDRISFTNFVKRMHLLTHDTTRGARAHRLFLCFDRDDSGYVSRKDFLYLFKAHYDLNKEIAREIVFAGDDGLLSEEDMITTIHANNPISAAFAGNDFRSIEGLDGLGKTEGDNGDLLLDGWTTDVIQTDSSQYGHRNHAIARETAARVKFEMEADKPYVMDSEDSRRLLSDPRWNRIQHNGGSQSDGSRLLLDGRSGNTVESGPGSDPWYNADIIDEDVIRALGTIVELDKITDVNQQTKILETQRERVFGLFAQSMHEESQTALMDRWQKRQFYIDEEEGFIQPIGYHESDDSDDESTSDFQHIFLRETKNGSGRTSIRSRSSSKVRFDIDDEEIESRSETSSRNTPLNERWGGIGCPPERDDTGVEVVYEAVQEAFNHMLDYFFKDVEDEAIVAQATRQQRRKHKVLLDEYEAKLLDDSIPGQNSTDQEGIIDSKNMPDPTLPQNRPDEGYEIEEINEQTLATWYKHRQLEEEADQRGGWGKLSESQFKRKLGGERSHEIDPSDELEDEHPYWEEKADLGRFSHLSTWIEMASF